MRAASLSWSRANFKDGGACGIVKAGASARLVGNSCVEAFVRETRYRCQGKVRNTTKCKYYIWPTTPYMNNNNVIRLYILVTTPLTSDKGLSAPCPNLVRSVPTCTVRTSLGHAICPNQSLCFLTTSSLGHCGRVCHY